MSLTQRIAAMIVALVAVTAVLSWGVAHRLVFRPLVEEVYSAYLAEVAFVGERLDRGGDPERLSRALDLEVRRIARPPPPHWRVETRRGRQLVRPPGPRNLVLVQTRNGWVEVRRGVDLDRPGRRLPLVFAVVAGAVIVLAVVIARRGVRPIGIATAAMSRMGAGELEHRLDERGPSELRTAAAAFNRMADRIAGMLRTEKRLMAGISHELRTPLTRLRLEIELLRDAGVDPARLDRMQGDLEQLDDLVGEALELSGLQIGDRPLEPTPIDLAGLAADTARSLGLADRVTIAGAGTVEADVRLVERAVRNLLRNAEKYTPPGTPIDLDVRGDGLVVRDHGPGVPEADLPHLFEPFYRTESGSRRAEGHGLGLMIVRMVMDRHGGEAHAWNAEPGLAVRLRFP